MTLEEFSRSGRRLAANSIAVLLTLVVVATACAGSTGEETAESASGLISEWTISQSGALVERLGSADTALDALFLSLNGGFDTAQVRDAVTDATLQADGSISNATPVNSPLGMILMADDEGESAGSYNVGAAPESLAFAQVPLLGIDQLRELARTNAGVAHANETEVGFQGVTFILGLIDSGFAPDDVIEMTVFGIDAAVTRGGIGGTGAARFGIELPGGCDIAYLVVNEFICDNGRRVPVEAEQQNDLETPDTTTPDQDRSDEPNSATDESPASDSQLSNGMYEGAFVLEDQGVTEIFENSVVVVVANEQISSVEGSLHLAQEEYETTTLDGEAATSCAGVTSSVFFGRVDTVQISEGTATLTLDWDGNYSNFAGADSGCEDGPFQFTTDAIIDFAGDQARLSFFGDLYVAPLHLTE